MVHASTLVTLTWPTDNKQQKQDHYNHFYLNKFVKEKYVFVQRTRTFEGISVTLLRKQVLNQFNITHLFSFKQVLYCESKDSRQFYFGNGRKYDVTILVFLDMLNDHGLIGQI